MITTVTVTATDPDGASAQATARFVTAFDGCPTLRGIAFSGSTVTMVYSKLLDGSSLPAAGDFTVKAGDSAVSLAATTPVRIDRNKVLLSLSAPVVQNATVTVSYAAGDNPIRSGDYDDVSNAVNALELVDHAAAFLLAPVFSSTRVSRSIAENSASHTSVGAAVLATDADSATLTYYLTGADAEHFGFNDIGQIVSLTRFDYESQQAYEVTVIASDGLLDASAAVTINVTDENEPPLAPRAPTVAPASATSVDVSWVDASTPGIPEVTSYGVRYKKSSDASWSELSQRVAATSSPLQTTITGLDPGTSYDVQINAANHEGTSGWSGTGTGKTDGVPGVAGVAISSTACTAGTYGLNDVIRVQVRFNGEWWSRVRRG